MIDEASLLVEVEGARTLDALEMELHDAGLTLGIELPESRGAMTIDAWIAAGTPGAPSAFADPADHVLAGLVATLRDGRTLAIRPSPRRAVGPDLMALFAGAGRRFGTIERAFVRVHRLKARRAKTPLPGVDLDPPLADAERALWERIAL